MRPYAPGIGKLGAQNRSGGFAAAMRVDESGKRFSAEQRRIAGQHDGKLRALANRAASHLHGVTGAALRMLENRLRVEALRER